MKANFETGMKVCSTCGVERPVGEFSKNRYNNDGFANQCKPCVAHGYGKYYGENKEYVLLKRKGYVEKNKDRVLLCQRKYRKENKEKLLLQIKELRKKYKVLGLCVTCGSELMENSNTFCETCWLKRTSFNNLGSVQHWVFLKELFEQQGCKCYYTGLDLVLGVNASIDHIKPRSKYPELTNDPSNVCWCDRSINRQKADRGQDEFKSELNELVFYGVAVLSLKNESP